VVFKSGRCSGAETRRLARFGVGHGIIQRREETEASCPAVDMSAPTHENGTGRRSSASTAAEPAGARILARRRASAPAAGSANSAASCPCNHDRRPFDPEFEESIELAAWGRWVSEMARNRTHPRVGTTSSLWPQKWFCNRFSAETLLSILYDFFILVLRCERHAAGFVSPRRGPPGCDHPRSFASVLTRAPTGTGWHVSLVWVR